MTTDRLQPDAGAPSGAGVKRAPAWAAAAVAVTVLVVIGILTWQLTGSGPQHAARTTIPAPPIVLRDAVASDANLARGGDLLAAGQLSDARLAFMKAERASGQSDDDRARAAAVGIALTTWVDAGPERVRQAIDTLGDQPGWDDDGYMTLHVGVIDLLRGGHRADAIKELRQAQASATHAHAWDIVRRADDLQHGSLPPGYPPIVVDPAGLRGRDASAARHLQALVSKGDRPGATSVAKQLLATTTPTQLRAIAWAAAWNKDDPKRDLQAMHRALDSGHLDLRLQVALLDLWSGDSRHALTELQVLADADARTHDDHVVVTIASRILDQRAANS